MRYFEAEILTLLISICHIDLWNVFIDLSVKLASSLLFHRGWPCVVPARRRRQRRRIHCNFFVKRLAGGQQDHPTTNGFLFIYYAGFLLQQPFSSSLFWNTCFNTSCTQMCDCCWSVICTPSIMCGGILLRETRRRTFLGFKMIFRHFRSKTDFM